MRFGFLVALSLARAGPMRALRSSRDSSTDETTIVPQSGEREERGKRDTVASCFLTLPLPSPPPSTSRAFRALFSFYLPPSTHFFSPRYTSCKYRLVQLNFTPEIEVFYIMFERSLSIFSMPFLKQLIKYFNFRSKM